MPSLEEEGENENTLPGPSLALTVGPGHQYHQPVESEKYQRPQSSFVTLLGNLILAVRPLQWVKNLLVFLPLLFSVNEAWEPGDVDAMVTLALHTAAAFAIFVLLSSSVYLLNDWVDIDRDRLHPRKRYRPIASGQLPVWLALTSASVLATLGLVTSFMFWPMLGAIGLAYIVIQDAYTVLLKRIVLLDLFCVASGFVLRVVAGAVIIGVPISPWLYLCSGLGALFIALSKRRSELVRVGKSAGERHDTLLDYTVGMLDQMIVVVAASALVSYGLYTFTAQNLPDNHAMMLTIPFVIFGLFRYIYLVHTSDAGARPEHVLITDIPLVTSIVLWLVTGWAALLWWG